MISRKALIEDTRFIFELIESIHPDPYNHGGGKIAFHRRLHHFLNSIPESGWSTEEYSTALLPIIAAIGDGHTYLIPPGWQADSKIVLPLRLKVIDKGIYVAGVYAEEHRHLLNCILVAVEGISTSKLAEREKKILAFENEYHNLNRLIYRLKKPATLKLLIPKWQKGTPVSATFIKPDKKSFHETFNIMSSLSEKIITSDSRISLPSTEQKDFDFRFVDKKKTSVLLRIADMQTYRECFEHWRFYNNHLNYLDLAKKTYQRYQQKPVPPGMDVNHLISKLPSATDCFRDLVIEMKQAGTKNLIIDLRENPGGISNITEILLYFLYGRKRVAEINSASYQIRKHSKLFYSFEEGEIFDPKNEQRRTPITMDDYDFMEEDLLNDAANKEKKIAYYLNQFDEMASHMPSFDTEYQSEKFEAYYTPENIIAVTSVETFSSAFWLLRCLYQFGAKIVGTPSGQAPNTFSDQYPFKLPQTGLTLYVSNKYSISFPLLGSKTDVLMPHYLLTYDKLKKYRFDPNAEIRLALDIYTGTDP